MLFDATLTRWRKEEKHLLFVTDFTPYVTKIAAELTTRLPQNGPNYMSCWMGCKRGSDQTNYSDVGRLTSNGKEVFQTSLYSLRVYSQDAVKYYEMVIQEFHPSDSSYIRIV